MKQVYPNVYLMSRDTYLCTKNGGGGVPRKFGTNNQLRLMPNGLMRKQPDILHSSVPFRVVHAIADHKPVRN